MEPPPPLPPRRTVNELASHGVVGARSAITCPGVNKNKRKIPSHVMSTIMNSTQFHGLDDEEAAMAEKVEEKKRGKRVAKELAFDVTKLPYPARAWQ
ncbi:hypothetical protein E3N88_12139 [Mikania micrantha]|uniref:Uncharacterized protein n=1 Tax=Mikania micrantha TaxID=192012 RepID=A0A5N6P4N0_9ASTR|nr:hypothetical protein E3N88_12139 [Mikania micrantha]